jgi:hypothetical protein
MGLKFFNEKTAVRKKGFLSFLFAEAISKSLPCSKLYNDDKNAFFPLLKYSIDDQKLTLPPPCNALSQLNDPQNILSPRKKSRETIQLMRNGFWLLIVVRVLIIGDVYDSRTGKGISITSRKFVRMPVRWIPYSFHRPKTFYHKILSASESSLPISLWIVAPSPVYWFNDPDTVCTLLIQPVVLPDSFWLCFASITWLPTKICSAGARQTSSLAYCGIITKSPFRYGKRGFLNLFLQKAHPKADKFLNLYSGL